MRHLLSLDSFHSIAYLFRRVKASGGIFCGDGQESETVSPALENLPAISFALLYNRNLYCIIVSLRTRIHNHSPPSERVFCRPAALKNLAIHKVLSAFFRLAGQQNPSPIRHPLIMNTGSKFYAIFCSGLGAGASRRLAYVRRCGGSQKIAGSRGSETA